MVINILEFIPNQLKEEKMTKCVNCGKEIPEDHGVCQECINLLISTTLTRENERSREILTKM